MPKPQTRKIDPALFMDDPNWAAFLPDLVNSGEKCGLPAHEDCTPLDVDQMAAHLSPGGTLGTMENYEPRPGQIDMLRAVTRCFNNRQHLMIEAGTGVGKSLAYLVPAVQWSFLNDTPVIISTATRNLQSQLISSDLPRAAQTLGDDAGKLRIALLKGRTNYLCLRMLAEYMQGGYWTLAEDEKRAFNHLVEWLERTPDGDLDDFGDDEMRSRLSCQSDDCAGRACPWRAKCFIAKARARAQRAHVVVANHALVLTEAANAASAILPAYGRIVLDEAHNLEDIATEFFSYELSRPVLTQLLGRLARTTRSRRGTGHMRGVLGSIEKQLHKGAFANGDTAAKVRSILTQTQLLMRSVQSDANALFEVAERLFSPAPKQTPLIRYRRPGPKARRQFSLNRIFTDYGKEQWNEGDLTQATAKFESALGALQFALNQLASTMKLAMEDGLPIFDDLATQVKNVADSLSAFILESKFVLSADDPSRVYWAERRPANPKTHQSAYLRLVAAPLSIADEMKRCFYDIKDSVVLCSATLRAGDKFDYMARKLGISLMEPERVKTLVASSPFDYLTQTCIVAPGCLPMPSDGNQNYPQALAPFLVELFKATSGRALALFTSYEMMRLVEQLTAEPLDLAGIQLISQGNSISREGMVHELKRAHRPTVLFGSQSFWEGVDVPGDPLSCVVIARLPFPQMGDPITEARCERICEQGGSDFRDYMVPEAIIRFRQGFGRLIRSRRDRGVVVITDSRIVGKNYGAIFRKALPTTVHSVNTLEEALQRVRDFLAEG